MVLSKSIQTKQERLQAVQQSLSKCCHPWAGLLLMEGASSTDLGCQLRPAHPKKPGRTQNFPKRRGPIDPSMPNHPAWEGGALTAALNLNLVRFSKLATGDGFSSPLFLQALSHCSEWVQLEVLGALTR